MNVDAFINEIKQSPTSVEFNDVMELIGDNYSFTETAFINGDLRNEAGENSGSCKLFSFAQQHGLSEDQTLACFGAYYREDVLENPDSDNHQNIRNFMKTGWGGIHFEGNALKSL